MERVRGPLRGGAAAARRVQQNTGTQLLLKILQKKKKADGAVERGRGLADGMAEKEDERPPPGRLVAPGTVSCRAPLEIRALWTRGTVCGAS